MSAVMETSAGVEEGRPGAHAARAEPAARAASGAGLQIDRVSKRYGSVQALQETTIEIPRGEFLTILGPSGSGKTTLLTIVAGFEHPTTGDLRVGGRSIVALPPEKRNFGMVFQGYALFPH
ncbi:ATP-binding cassette domain-containing protein, partial [Burkholderia sp.]